jgi:hypothetical protein
MLNSVSRHHPRIGNNLTAGLNPTIQRWHGKSGLTAHILTAIAEQAGVTMQLMSANHPTGIDRPASAACINGMTASGRSRVDCASAGMSTPDSSASMPAMSERRGAAQDCRQIADNCDPSDSIHGPHSFQFAGFEGHCLVNAGEQPTRATFVPLIQVIFSITPLEVQARKFRTKGAEFGFLPSESLVRPVTRPNSPRAR